MQSQALQSFLEAITEISHLSAASIPSIDPNSSNSLKIARAIGRGQIVLLFSHFERYIYAVNEEIVSFLNNKNIRGDNLPTDIRLLHSKPIVDDLGKMSWENRENKLTSFVGSEAWLWTLNSTGILKHDNLLLWMKSPKPDNLKRFFNYWGIVDIFSIVTRKPITRANLRLQIQGLVDLRNNIAHGDFGAQVTKSDVRLYALSVQNFCVRADRQLARRISRDYNIGSPW